MTSPVNTSVKFFHSLMTNAPAVSGTAGTLVALLDACLVDGFDLKTATSLVVAGGVATLTFSGTHSALLDSVILVDGSSITALNGEQKVTAVGANTVSFATAASDGTATGTITFKMAPLGWTKAYTGTNLAAYRSLQVGASGFYLRVDDTGTLSARVVGYEAMSAISTGTGPFPTAAQISGGLHWTKSGTANATANQWFLAGDGLNFYVGIAPTSGATPTNLPHSLYAFGDLIPYRDAGDPWTCTLTGAPSSTTSTPHIGTLTVPEGTGTFAVRNFTGLSTSFQSLNYAFCGSTSSATIAGADSTLGAFPSRVDGSLRLSRRFLRSFDSSYPEPRAEIPGVVHIPQTGVYDQTGRFSTHLGAGSLAGRKIIFVPAGTTNSTVTGVHALDITGPWR